MKNPRIVGVVTGTGDTLRFGQTGDSVAWRPDSVTVTQPDGGVRHAFATNELRAILVDRTSSAPPLIATALLALMFYSLMNLPPIMN